MVRCPVCESVQFAFLASPRPTSCYYCGATWLQDGSEQTAVRGSQPRDGKSVNAPSLILPVESPLDLLQ
jgi:hypothetical protein